MHLLCRIASPGRKSAFGKARLSLSLECNRIHQVYSLNFLGVIPVSFHRVSTRVPSLGANSASGLMGNNRTRVDNHHPPSHARHADLPGVCEVPPVILKISIMFFNKLESLCRSGITDVPFFSPRVRTHSRTVASEIGFRFSLTLQLSRDPLLGLLALTPCQLPPSNVPARVQPCLHR